MKFLLILEIVIPLQIANKKKKSFNLNSHNLKIYKCICIEGEKLYVNSIKIYTASCISISLHIIYFILIMNLKKKKKKNGLLSKYN